MVQKNESFGLTAPWRSQRRDQQMPSSSPHPCGQPGCGNLVQGASRCPAHAPAPSLGWNSKAPRIRGRKLQDILRERVPVQEGVHSAESVAALARRHDVDMPITLAVDQVLNHGADVEEAVARLLAHPYHYDRVTAK